MFYRWFLVLVAAATIAQIEPALAQFAIASTAVPNQNYVAIYNYNGLDCPFLTFGSCTATGGVDLKEFASTANVNASLASVNSQLAATNGNVATLQSQMNAANGNVATLQSQMNTANGTLTTLQGQLAGHQDALRKMYDLVAVSAALADAIPNQGDRFAFRLNMAGYQGHLAGAIGGSLNINEMLRISANYGRGRDEQMFSGGLNISFH